MPPIYITPEDALTDNHQFEDLDNAVFQDGSNWVFAVAGAPPELIEDVYVGNNPLAWVYAGADLVHENSNAFTLTSTVDVNLETWLAAQTPDVDRPIIITIPAGSVIGSTDKTIPSVVSGDLSAYTKGVTLNVVGEIQGVPEGNAFENTTEMWLHNSGAIRAGGGNGGTGGKGGNGDDVNNWDDYRYQLSNALGYDFWSNAPSSRAPFYTGIYWKDIQYLLDQIGIDDLYKRSTVDLVPSMFQRGIVRHHVGDNIYFTHEVRRGDYLEGIGGDGGAGGTGQGYLVPRDEGEFGLDGTNRAGYGGKGGTGGDWGQAGFPGAPGGAGLYYSSLISEATREGLPGEEDSAPGITVNALAELHYSGDGTLNGTSEGNISPVVTISRPAPGECEYQYPDTECSSQTTILSTHGYFTNAPDVYEWSSVGATILSGQGTDAIVVETTSSANINFTVTLIATNTQAGESASVTANFTDIRNIDQSVDYNGTAIIIPDMDVDAEMTEVDVSGSFDGFAESYYLTNFPNGLSIDSAGIISGTPTETGAFYMTVTAVGEINEASADPTSFNVLANEFTPTLLYDKPLSDVPVPVEITDAWPFEQKNNFLLCAKFEVPDIDLVTDNPLALWFRWDAVDHYIGIQCNKAANQLLAIYHDGTTYQAIKWNQLNNMAGQTVEIKAFKSATRGWLAWKDNVKNTAWEYPSATADLSAFNINDFYIGHRNGTNLLNAPMSCVQIYTGDMTDEEIESITLCESAVTPPPGTLDYLEDGESRVPPADPNIVRDFSAHKHPKTIFIETNITNQGDAASHELFLKYQQVYVQPNQMKGGSLITEAGHQFVGSMWTTPQSMEHLNEQFQCSQGHGIPFSGTTPSTGDMVDSSNYGYKRPYGDCTGGVFAGHWMYQAGTTITQAINSEDTQIYVNPAHIGRFNTGQYALIRNATDNWGSAEHVKVVSKGSDYLIVERGYLSTKVGHGVNSYICQHQLNDQNNVLYWSYNVATTCPVDGNGVKYNEYCPQYQHDHVNENISYVYFPNIDNIGTAYDVDFDYLIGTNADVDNDGVADDGYGPNGERYHINGWAEFYNNVNLLDPPKVQIGGTLYSEMSNINGTQLESMFGGFGSSYATKNFSAYMADLKYREHWASRGPANNHLLFKQDTAVYPYIGLIANPENAPWRIGMGAAMMEGAYMMHQAKLAPDSDMWYDEYAVNLNPAHPTLAYGQSPLKGNKDDCLATIGWLGDPVDTVRKRIYDNNTFDTANAMVAADFETDLDDFLSTNVTLTRVTDTQMSGVGSLHASTMNVYDGGIAGANVRTPVFNVTSGKEYTLCFSAKASAERRIRTVIGSHQPDSILMGTEWRRYVMVFRPNTANSIRAFWYVGKQNTEFWLDDVYLFEGGADAWQREFDNGIVCLNLTNQDKTFDLGAGSYQRILGSNGAGGAPQDSVNNGISVSTNLIVPARDAAILVRQQP